MGGGVDQLDAQHLECLRKRVTPAAGSVVRRSPPRLASTAGQPIDVHQNWDGRQLTRLAGDYEPSMERGWVKHHTTFFSYLWFDLSKPLLSIPETYSSPGRAKKKMRINRWDLYPYRRGYMTPDLSECPYTVPYFSTEAVPQPDGERGMRLLSGRKSLESARAAADISGRISAERFAWL